MLLSEPMARTSFRNEFHENSYLNDNEQKIFLSLDFSAHKDPPMDMFSKGFLHFESRVILD